MRFNPADILDTFIWVGDLHVKKENIEESRRIMKWVDEQAQLNGGVPVILAGDQYNDHSIARVEVVSFWTECLRNMKSKVIALVGNHDANSDMSLSFMDSHNDNAFVVSKPWISDARIAGHLSRCLLLPFFRKNDDFIQALVEAASLGVKTVFCHQEANGGHYDNGFYSSGGFDMSLIPESISILISGHIHKNQEFGKIWYPGTARHLTRSDIGEVKGIWLMNVDGSQRSFIPTPKEVSEPFTQIDIVEGITSTFDIKSTDSARTFVNITGSSDYIKNMIRAIPETAKVRTFPDSETVESKIKESEGIPKAFMNFVLDYSNKKGLGNSEVKLILEKIYDQCPSLKGVSL